MANKVNHLGLTPKDSAVALGLKHHFSTEEVVGEKVHVSVFSRFLDRHSPQKILVLRTSNGKAQSYLDLSLDQVKTNLSLLRNEQGIFYSEEDNTGQAITDDKTFFAVISPSKLECAVDDTACNKLESALEEHEIEYKKD